VGKAVCSAATANGKLPCQLKGCCPAAKTCELEVPPDGLTRDEFKATLEKIDSKLRALPATAQVITSVVTRHGVLLLRGSNSRVLRVAAVSGGEGGSVCDELAAVLERIGSKLSASPAAAHVILAGQEKHASAHAVIQQQQQDLKFSCNELWGR
jgi:hypothetical protein